MNTPTPEQQAIIDAQQGTVLVLAAVGSGKTSTLSARVARTLATGVPPERVLALTFTNRAARHMRAGLVDAVGAELAARVELSTFHGLCARLLRAEADSAGLSPDFRILGEDDAIDLLRELGAHTPQQAFFQLGQESAEVPPGRATLSMVNNGSFSRHPMAARYAGALVARGVVDFSGLVLLTRALLTEMADLRDRHADRFDAVLVDEVQDTHLSEYEVMAVMAANACSFCLVGDLDQTIYGWRGSAPQALLDHLEADFGPVQRLTLTANFRSTRQILALADRIAQGLPDRATHVQPHVTLDEGLPPEILACASPAEEVCAVAEGVAASVALGRSADRIAVLVRTNRAVTELGAALDGLGVPHATVEQFRFFRRREVKDALALATLVWNRREEGAARRVASALVRGVGLGTVTRLVREGHHCGLRLGDLLDPLAVAHLDPLWGLFAPEVVVLDTETTGLDPRIDEVIEVAAVRVANGAVVDRTEALVQNTVPVGDSEKVHGISDARLATDGRPAAEVMAEVRRFVGDTPIAGHNVTFDRAMLLAHARRVEVPLDLEIAFDTLPVARRFVAADSYRLGSLVTQLGIEAQATHRAMDDVLATVALAAILRQRATPGAPSRRALMLAEASLFARLRATLDTWAALDLRPGALVARVTADALRHKVPPDEPWRLDNLAALSRRLDERDDPSLPAADALALAIEQATLSRDVDQLDDTPGVRIITMHQSKGLEFEEVWVPGLAEGGVPSWMTIRDGDPDRIDEERRLLYVAVTRARERVHLSWSRIDERGEPVERSRFLRGVDG